MNHAEAVPSSYQENHVGQRNIPGRQRWDDEGYEGGGDKPTRKQPACSLGERDQHGDHDDCTWIDDGTSDGVEPTPTHTCYLWNDMEDTMSIKGGMMEEIIGTIWV